MKLFKILLVGLCVGLFSEGAFAVDSGIGQITNMGCHTGDETCFVSLNVPVFGAEFGCASTQARWPVNSYPNGKVALAQLTAAWLAGKRVGLNIVACYNGWPTFNWYNIFDNP